MKANTFLTLLCILVVANAYPQGQSIREGVKEKSAALIPLKNITLTPSGISQPFSGVENIVDGKKDSDRNIFHTLWGRIPQQPVVIEADLDGKGKRLDKVVISPCGNGLNGIIKSAEIWIMVKSEYKKVADISAANSNAPLHLELDSPVEHPEKIKLVVTDAYGDSNSPDTYFVSLGELECVMMPDDAITRAKLIEDSKIFADLTGTKLHRKTSLKDIRKLKVPAIRDLALNIHKGTYNPQQLIADYESYLKPAVLGRKMRIGDGFSKYEGITGIVLEKGDHIVFMGETNGADIGLVIPEWTRMAPEGVKREEDPAGWGLKSETHQLKEGANIVRVENGGLAYIQYFTEDNPESHPPISVHFPTGKFNGYFDVTRGDTDSDFNALLDNAVSPILDMRGKYTQVAFPVDSLKRFTWNRGVELMQNFDSIVALQRQFIGWDKEGFTPKNHVLARINYHYYMFRDRDGVAYIDWAMRLVADPSSIVKGDPCWGFSHELGHVLQMRPQLTWGGMTEVSNNIMTLYSTTTLGNRSRLSEEGVYAKSRETILDKGISYMYFPGQEASSSQYGGGGNTDVFHRLVPFWQLHLYFSEQGYPDFYPDLMIRMREQEPLGGGDPRKDYLNMLEFCRLACEVSKTDLTEFFDRWGFFYVGDIVVNDYRMYRYTVLQKEVDAVKKAIAEMNHPKPVKDITMMED